MKNKTLLMICLVTQSVYGQLSPEDSLNNLKKYRSCYYQSLVAEDLDRAANCWSNAFEYARALKLDDPKLYRNGRVLYLKRAKNFKKSDSLSYLHQMDTVSLIYKNALSFNMGTKWSLDYAVHLMNNGTPDNHQTIDSLMLPAIQNHDVPRASHLESYFYWKTKAKPHSKLKLYLICSDVCLKNMHAHDDSAKFWAADMRMRVVTMKQLMTDTSALTIIQKWSENYDEEPAIWREQVNRDLELLTASGNFESSYYHELIGVYLDKSANAEAYGEYGISCVRNKQYELGIQAYEKAIALSTDSVVNQEWIYQKAATHYLNGDFKKAFRSAKKVKGKYKGKAMIICGNSIAANTQECGTSTFERNANYWLANDYYVKAHQLGEDVSPDQFLSSAPTLQDYFDGGFVKGQKVYLLCWDEWTLIR
jgi:tetratricopeptide (TPR) repeat protein